MKKSSVLAILALTLAYTTTAWADLTAPSHEPIDASCSASGNCPDGSTGSCSVQGRYTHCKAQYNNEGPTCWVSNSGGECESTDAGCTKVSGCRK